MSDAVKALIPALTPDAIRAARAENPKARARDFAAVQGITEAALVAAYIGEGVTRIEATPSRLLPMIGALGEVLALTRNESCVAERVGVYGPYQGGVHAGMILGDEIDMRIFPGHWVYGFAVVDQTEAGPKRSVQVFDAQGQAVHKVYLRPASDVAAFEALIGALAVADQSQDISVLPATPTEAARTNPDKADALRLEWSKMTDTHQFMILTQRLKMNRLGAYRVAGAPFVKRLAPEALALLLERASAQDVPVMVFVGNKGCIQIHSGPVKNIKMMGPWLNVLDPSFDLHLRGDHMAEVYLVEKPTKRGAAISVEAFDKDGGLILQIFGKREHEGHDRWNTLAAGLLADAPAVAADAAEVAQ